MVEKKVNELKQGDVISVFGEKVKITKIESSGKGIKQGRVKFRLETESLQDKKPGVIIRLAEDLVEVQ